MDRRDLWVGESKNFLLRPGQTLYGKASTTGVRVSVQATAINEDEFTTIIAKRR